MVSVYSHCKTDDFTEEELTFYWSDEDYKEFLDELKSYEQAVK